MILFVKIRGFTDNYGYKYSQNLGSTDFIRNPHPQNSEPTDYGLRIKSGE
jgi:hypothetical protein